MTSRRAVKASSAGLIFDAIATARTRPAGCKQGSLKRQGCWAAQPGTARQHSAPAGRRQRAVGTGLLAVVSTQMLEGVPGA